jgi:hypothetical protein
MTTELHGGQRVAVTLDVHRDGPDEPPYLGPTPDSVSVTPAHLAYLMRTYPERIEILAPKWKRGDVAIDPNDDDHAYVYADPDNAMPWRSLRDDEWHHVNLSKDLVPAKVVRSDG